MSSITKILQSKLLQLLILLAGIVLIFLIYKKYIRKTREDEGFQQNERFILKSDEYIYDDFYGEIYDEIMLPENRVKYEVDTLIQTLSPSTQYSIMLDVGTGTGCFMKYLKDLGYTVYGIEKSEAMIDVARDKYENTTTMEIKCASVEDPMAYDRAIFTHIFCMNFTIYEMKDKLAFFKNAYFWLQNNGYLILHLVNKDKFNKIIPVGKPLQNFQEDHTVNKTAVEFPDFTYLSEYIENEKPDGQWVHKETFTDKKTQNIRQNENTLYMETEEEILQMANIAGFTAKGMFSLENGPSKDRWQNIYILQRIM